MTDRPEMVIPLDRLPPGFAERVGDQAAPAAPTRPAATAVLLRQAAAGPELLLLKRHRAAGFVPGAWVFPGGRVDEADADPDLVTLLDPVPATPEPAYWLATIRETFEETGVLLARDAAGRSPAPAAADPAMAGWRRRLLDGDADLLEMLTALGLRPDTRRMVYCAHWITPAAEPRRYDTRFFLAELPEGATVTIDEREMSDALWVTPGAAMEGFGTGRLPMVFPTVKTIQRLAAFPDIDAILDTFAAREPAPILPRLVRTRDGVGIVMPDEDA
jgi:recombination protein RecT